MPQVIPCPSCGRPNGPKYTRCMYCGTELPERDEPATADAAEGSDERSEQFASTMDPKLLASLPPKLRAQIQAETDPPREPPAPAQFVSPAPPPLGVDPALAEEELEATITGEHASVGDLLSGEHAAVISASGAYAQVDEDDVQTDQYRSVAVPGADSPLLRGRGPFGPRDAAARVLLVPDPGYRQNLPWLRVRLNNLMGLDAYTANLYLQREFPVFLEAFEEMSEAWALEDDLIAGGMRVLVLTREMVEGHREAFYADNAEVDATSVLFSAAGEAPLQVERLDLEAALLGEIKPLEQPDRPLVERTFWRNKARESLRLPLSRRSTPAIILAQPQEPAGVLRLPGRRGAGGRSVPPGSTRAPPEGGIRGSRRRPTRGRSAVQRVRADPDPLPPRSPWRGRPRRLNPR